MASNYVNILLLHVSFIPYKSILLRHIVILFSSHITKACYQYNGSDVYHLLFVYLSFIHNIDSESVNISIIYKNLEGYEWQSGLVHTDHHPNTKNQEKLLFCWYPRIMISTTIRKITITGYPPKSRKIGIQGYPQKQ